MKTLKGRYRPTNPTKYMGDPTNIIYRSSWELKFMKWCDFREDVVQWQSEEFCIPYKHPLDGKVHRYFPDFLIKVKNNSGIIETLVIEVKPANQTKEPKPQKNKTRRYLNEVKTYAVNRYKWDYAKVWCENRGYRFMIITENELFSRKNG